MPTFTLDKWQTPSSIRMVRSFRNVLVWYTKCTIHHQHMHKHIHTYTKFDLCDWIRHFMTTQNLISIQQILIDLIVDSITTKRDIHQSRYEISSSLLFSWHIFNLLHHVWSNRLIRLICLGKNSRTLNSQHEEYLLIMSISNTYTIYSHSIYN